MLLLDNMVGLQALGLSVDCLSGEAPLRMDTGGESRHLDGYWMDAGAYAVEYTVPNYSDSPLSRNWASSGPGERDITGDSSQ